VPKIERQQERDASDHAQVRAKGPVLLGRRLLERQPTLAGSARELAAQLMEILRELA
jgi:hypothetical protein